MNIPAIDIGHAEGWGVFDTDCTGVLSIQRLDETDLYASDAEALDFVEARAEEGSQLHINALARVGGAA